MPHRTALPAYLHLLLIVLLGLAAQPAAASAPDSPREVIIGTSERLITALQAQHDTLKQDLATAYRLAEETVLPHVDFPRMTRWVLGRHWRAASEEQRARLTEEFRALLTRSYVTAMVTYVDQILDQAENVQYPPARSRQEGDMATVTMLISQQDGQQAVVQYQMYLSDTGWKVYDLQVEGISLALTYRSTFSEEISRSGIDGLIASLTARNQREIVEPLPDLPR
ncbi:MAG: phospholipid-binding protein MlaC [Gammaproteobacteria bacterium]